MAGLQPAWRRRRKSGDIPRPGRRRPSPAPLLIVTFSPFSAYYYRSEHTNRYEKSAVVFFCDQEFCSSVLQEESERMMGSEIEMCSPLLQRLPDLVLFVDSNDHGGRSQQIV